MAVDDELADCLMVVREDTRGRLVEKAALTFDLRNPLRIKPKTAMVETTYGTRAAMPALVELENVAFEGFMVRRRRGRGDRAARPGLLHLLRRRRLRPARPPRRASTSRRSATPSWSASSTSTSSTTWPGGRATTCTATSSSSTCGYGENALVRAKPWLITAGVVALSPLRGGRAEARNVRRALKDARAGAWGGAATAAPGATSAALPVAVEHAQRWLDSLDDRPVPPQAQVEELVERLGTALPDGPQDAAGSSSTWPPPASRG